MIVLIFIAYLLLVIGRLFIHCIVLHAFIDDIALFSATRLFHFADSLKNRLNSATSEHKEIQ